jgi:isopenicillin-N epimerase
MNLPVYSEYAQFWSLDHDMVFLNHGSFGATPTSILAKQQALRARMESEPVRFMVRELETLYMENKKALASFLHADADDMVFVKNATMGVNTILQSLRFEPGDEILTHSHVYGACYNTLVHHANKWGAELKIAQVPFPIEAAEQVTEVIRQAISPKTKLLLIDHITSPTGLVFPVDDIVSMAEGMGVEVLVDGAHAPGMLDLNIVKINASYYTGNCHKWICSPKGSAFLHVRKDKQAKIFPLQISHTHDHPETEAARWSAQFFWPGTDDNTAYCCLKDSIEFMGNLMPGGWPALRERNRNLAIEAREMLCKTLDIQAPAPDSMIAQLVTLPWAKAIDMPYYFNSVHPLGEKLFNEFHIEIPVFQFGAPDKMSWFRISPQAYNSMEQYAYLAKCLKSLQ